MKANQVARDVFSPISPIIYTKNKVKYFNEFKLFN